MSTLHSGWWYNDCLVIHAWRPICTHYRVAISKHIIFLLIALCVMTNCITKLIIQLYYFQMRIIECVIPNHFQISLFTESLENSSNKDTFLVYFMFRWKSCPNYKTSCTTSRHSSSGIVWTPIFYCWIKLRSAEVANIFYFGRTL